MIWFTADYHLSHKNIIEYCNRPFTNVEEMNAMIINNLDKSIKKGDVLYFLGDLTFKTEVALEMSLLCTIICQVMALYQLMQQIKF